MLVCCGGLAGGYSVFLKDGRLHWEHNYYNEVHYRVSSTETIPPGHHVLSAEVKVDEEGTFGTGGDVTLRLGKSKIGDGRFDKQVAGFFHGQRKLRRRLATPARPSRNCTNRRSPSPAPSSRCGGYQ